MCKSAVKTQSRRLRNGSGTPPEALTADINGQAETIAGVLAGTGIAISAGEMPGIEETAAVYPLKVTPYYQSLVSPGNREDPVFKQFFPDSAELENPSYAAADALGEETDSPVPGLVHRYPNRALLLLTGECAVHCRHCLRKRRWQTGHITEPALQNALEYLQQTPEIIEVILSGGDPLLLPDSFFFRILEELRQIPHLRIIRLATRLPVVLPQRFNRSFCARLSRCQPLWLVTHFNHPSELSDAAAAACGNIVKAGIPMLNQTVLLRGINNHAGTLAELFHGLLNFGVKPYYLFHGDPIRGTAHFRTGLRQGLQIMRELRQLCSGIALPVYALDLPDGKGKIVLNPDSEPQFNSDGTVTVRDHTGTDRLYPDADIQLPCQDQSWA